jgi:tetratricopeptide (TPR) repeat protein
MLRTEIFKEYCVNKDLSVREEEVRMLLLENPTDIKLLRELAAILYYKKEAKEAIKIYEKLIRLEPENADFLAFLGYLYYELDIESKAIEYFNRSLDISPDAPFVYFLLGNAYSRNGDIISAIKSYDFSIFLDFDIYTAHLDFAKKYEDMGRIQRALKEYITAYEIDPRDEEIKNKIMFLKKELECA